MGSDLKHGLHSILIRLCFLSNLPQLLKEVYVVRNNAFPSSFAIQVRTICLAFSLCFGFFARRRH